MIMLYINFKFIYYTQNWSKYCSMSFFFQVKIYVSKSLQSRSFRICPPGPIYNIRTLSVNIKFICTSFRNRQNGELFRGFTIFLGWRYFLECRRYQTISARGSNHAVRRWHCRIPILFPDICCDLCEQSPCKLLDF
jgi:hypothetical protein